MEVVQLEQFLKIVEFGSFTRAAEELHLSQSALSRSISKLEEELGQPVFERQARKLLITEAGKTLQARAQQIIGIIEDTKAEICDDGKSGRVRLGAIPTIAPFLLPSLLKTVRKRFPQVTVVVQEDVTERLIRRTQQGEIDLAILAMPISAKYVEVEPLFDEELLLALPPDHPLVEKKSIALADLKSYPFVMLDEAHCLSDNIVTFCRQRSYQPVAVERTSQLATVQELVALGHGISLIPAMAKKLDRSEGRRVYRSIAGTRPTRTIAMIWNAYRFQTKLLAHFLDVVREYRAD